MTKSRANRNDGREDRLISRVVDRTADADDWETLRCLADGDPGIWSRLADTLHHQTLLESAVGERSSGEGNSLAGLGVLPARPPGKSSGRRAHRVWLAAAGLLVGAGVLFGVMQLFGPGREAPAVGPGSAGPGSAGMSPSDPSTGGPTDPANRVKELPGILVYQAPAADGQGIDVVYLRRVLERKRVEGLYEVGADENGQFLATPVEPSRLRPVASF